PTDRFKRHDTGRGTPVQCADRSTVTPARMGPTGFLLRGQTTPRLPLAPCGGSVTPGASLVVARLRHEPEAPPHVPRRDRAVRPPRLGDRLHLRRLRKLLQPVLVPDRRPQPEVA